MIQKVYKRKHIYKGQKYPISGTRNWYCYNLCKHLRIYVIRLKLDQLGLLINNLCSFNQLSCQPNHRHGANERERERWVWRSSDDLSNDCSIKTSRNCFYVHAVCANNHKRLSWLNWYLCSGTIRLIWLVITVLRFFPTQPYLSHQAHRWGSLQLALPSSFCEPQQRYLAMIWVTVIFVR